MFANTSRCEIVKTEMVVVFWLTVSDDWLVGGVSAEGDVRGDCVAGKGFELVGGVEGPGGGVLDERPNRPAKGIDNLEPVDCPGARALADRTLLAGRGGSGGGRGGRGKDAAYDGKVNEG